MGLVWDVQLLIKSGSCDVVNPSVDHCWSAGQVALFATTATPFVCSNGEGNGATFSSSPSTTLQTVHHNFETEQQTQTLSKSCNICRRWEMEQKMDNKNIQKQQRWFLTCCNKKEIMKRKLKEVVWKCFWWCCVCLPTADGTWVLFYSSQNSVSPGGPCTRCPGEVAECWPNWHSIFEMFRKQFIKIQEANTPQMPHFQIGNSLP